MTPSLSLRRRVLAGTLALVALQVVAAQSSRKTECDARCQTQVKLLEGALLFTILAITVGSGVWLLGSVDTPTRFGGAAQD